MISTITSATSRKMRARLRLGFGHRNLVVARVDFHQHIAGLDELGVLDKNFAQVTKFRTPLNLMNLPDIWQKKPFLEKRVIQRCFFT